MQTNSDPLDFFNDAARVGAEILDSASPNVKKQYLDQVALIYRLMAEIHDLVSDVAIRASLADDLPQAQRALSALDHNALEQTLRVRNYCDRLERLGRQLHPLMDDARLSGRSRDVWDELCQSMEQREVEVAWLYYQRLPTMGALAASAQTMQELRQKLGAVSQELVMQKAQFDFLAKRAEAERDRIRW